MTIREHLHAALSIHNLSVYVVRIQNNNAYRTMNIQQLQAGHHRGN